MRGLHFFRFRNERRHGASRNLAGSAMIKALSLHLSSKSNLMEYENEPLSKGWKEEKGP